jgi:uncharacterized membrane protein HdeD (DUF308 family)
MKTRWWHVSAIVIGVLMLMVGIGDFVSPDNTGPLYGQLILFAVMATGAALIVYGLTLVRRHENRGGKFVAVGVLPGSVGIALFWFPPAVAVGILALITSWAAFSSSSESARQTAAP